VNAGDGRHEHPTQALLDVFTIRRHVGPDLSALRAVVIGDVRHSRVARSTTKALHALGAHVTLVGPPTLLPECLEGWGAHVSCDLDAALQNADVVYLLRIQLERQEAGLFPSQREYTARYGLTAERAHQLPAEVLIMHPGPMNRGVEIDAVVADSKSSAITEQVTNGVAVRMAVLYQLLGSGAPVA
jgi:aspartate carbamoyltransferase catalytic subunit